MLTTTNSWSKQVLVQEEYRTGDEVRTENALIVCNQGLDLFQKEFIDGKHWGDITPILPFDFIVLAGHPCPRGKFYEVEYTEGDKYGLIHRALIQAVDPVTDLPLVIGALMHKGYVHSFIVPHKAYLRDDIDAVCIVGCHEDEATKGAYIVSGHVTPREEEYSILDTVIGRDPSAPFMVKGAVCLEFYAAEHCVEVWLDPDDKFERKPIFVCGSSNVFDPAFEEQRREDLAELKERIDDAMQILNDYGLQHVIYCELGEPTKGDDGKTHTPALIAHRGTPGFIYSLHEFLLKKYNDESDAAANSANHEQG